MWSALLAIGTFLVSCALLFHAGQVGDTKVGISGDPSRALLIEDLALPFDFAASIFAVVWLHVRTKDSRLPKNVLIRSLVFCGATFGTFICFWIFGFWIEGLGVGFAR